MEVNNRIKQERKKLHLTQSEFASKFNSLISDNNLPLKPITYATLSRWESGTHEPRLEAWDLLAKCFNVDVEYLQGVSNIRNAKEYLAEMQASIQKKNSQSLEELYGEEFSHVKDEKLRGTIFQALDIFRSELLGLSRVEQTTQIKDANLKFVVESLNKTQIESIRKILKLTANSREVVTLATAGKLNTTSASNQLKQLQEGLAMLQAFNTLLDDTSKHLKQLH